MSNNRGNKGLLGREKGFQTFVFKQFPFDQWYDQKTAAFKVCDLWDHIKELPNWIFIQKL